MKFYNTLSRRLEDFKPAGTKVTLYTCGPTVYNSAHIGNLRTYLFEDILKRTLKLSGYPIKHVMNITDIDDKIIGKSGGDLLRFKELTKKYEKLFFVDLGKLNIEKADQITRATEFIDQIIKFIQELIDKGFAYNTDDGSVYFSIAKFKDYGKLSQLNRDGLKVGARVNQDEYDKENPADFALWKAYEKNDGEVSFDSPWGKGRPGWHIECSVMSQDTLGQTIDIHAGAVDLIFPHHENEIAQSEARTGQPFARFWIHGEHLLVDGKKMSKSLNNFYILNDIIQKGYGPLDFRYFCLLGHYRSKLNFTWEGLNAAKNALLNLQQHIIRLKDLPNADEKLLSNAKNNFLDACKNDLDTPRAIGAFQELINKCLKLNTGGQKLVDLIREFDTILALDLIKNIEIPAKIKKLADERLLAKKSGDFKKADELRDQIIQAKYIIEDKPDSYKLLPK